MKPQVHNRYKGTAPADAVYIGRGSKWGNHFVIGPDGTRGEVIRAYERSLSPEFREVIRAELAGKHLVCFCKPQPCHGDVLLAIANPPSHS